MPARATTSPSLAVPEGVRGRAESWRRAGWAAILSAALAVCASSPAVAAKLNVVCPAFRDGDKLARSMSCEGGEHSPAMSISGVPEGTVSLAVLLAEADQPRDAATLWMLANIAPNTQQIPENLPRTRNPKGEWLQFAGTGGKLGYNGPCPPQGATRRYALEVFALDTTLDLPENATRQEFLTALEGHILARIRLTARYKK